MMRWWRKGPAYWRSVRAGRSSPRPSRSPLVSRPPLMKLGGVSQSLGQARGGLFLFNLTGSWTPRFARKRLRSSTWPVKRLLVQFRDVREASCHSARGVERTSFRCDRWDAGSADWTCRLPV